MAQINWRPELDPSGNRVWKGNGPFDDLPDSIWEIRTKNCLVSSDLEFHIYASDDLGGHGYEPDALSMDWFLDLHEAKACCQQMHDEAISGSDTGW